VTVALDACHAAADAMDVAADVIVGLKAEAIAELVVMAAAFVADQAAAVATFGLAEAALALIEEAATKLVEFLKQQVIQHIEAAVIGAAITPLMDTVVRAVKGLAFEAVSAALGVSGGGGVEGFSIDPEAVRGHVQVMRDHADAVRGHAQAFAVAAGSVSFA
jgi:hypothetical protein